MYLLSLVGSVSFFSYQLRVHVFSCMHRTSFGTLNLPELRLPEYVVHRSIDIVQLLLSQAMALDGGDNQNSSQMNVTIPGSLNFTLYGLSSFTEYSVYAVATYIETHCSRSTYDGGAIKIRTERKCMCINFVHLFD